MHEVGVSLEICQCTSSMEVKAPANVKQQLTYKHVNPHGNQYLYHVNIIVSQTQEHIKESSYAPTGARH